MGGVSIKYSKNLAGWTQWSHGEQYPNTAPLQLPSGISAGRIYCGTDLAECISAPRDFFRRQGAFFPGFYPLRVWVELGSSPGTWGTPNKGNADGAVGIFENAGRVWAPALRLDPPKKRPGAIHTH